MKILIFDFEVFKYDTLLGVYDVNESKYFQTWNLNEIREFYRSNIDSIWIGHNNSGYDNYILQAIVKNKNPYDESKYIITNHKPGLLKIKLFYYDLMQWHSTSLKTLEAFMGKNISESEVDFDIDRPLTEEEKKLTESYNRDDLDQTFEDLKLTKSEFTLRLDLIKEFKLPLDALHFTEARIAATVLGAKRIEGIESWAVEPNLYKNLQLKNREVKNFYLNKDWANKKRLNMTFCGANHTIASGGIHAGNLKHVDFAYYLDVSGYYNLIMINFNLLPRSIPEVGKKLYEYMYHEQLRLKKIDPIKRAVYKTILLAVFGAQNNEYCDFYDPHQGDLVRLTGEIFLVDLLEKLEGKAEVIQSNTDGIMIKPLVNEEILKNIIDEWQNRTGFVLKFEKIYNIIQRDVNNYMYKDESGKIHVKGEALKHWNGVDSPFITNAYASKEPLIIAKGIVEYYMNNKSPEDTVNELKNDLRWFQYICKTLSYDYLSYGDEKLQKVNRCFASKNGLTIYRNKEGKHDKYPSLPDMVFVYNGSLNINLTDKIDYNYYVRRIKERINEFKLKPEQLYLF